MSEPRYIFDEPDDLKRLSEMVFVEGGTFRMGDEGTEHLVKLNAFYIGKFPVTQALWKEVTNVKNPSAFKGDNRPVERVSWKEAESFIKKLNQRTGKTFGLPTEAQWEYAAKGGIYAKDFPFPFSGSHKINEVGWYDENSHQETKPVGLKTPNLLGIHDMTGNVWEWCNDWYGSYDEVIKQSQKDGLTGAIINPHGVKEGTDRVFRGGSWYGHNAQVCRSTFHGSYTPTLRHFTIGFRLVLVIPSVWVV